MPSGSIDFPGVIFPRHMLVTRTTGVRPDTIILNCVPQVLSPDTSGTSTLMFSFNGIGFFWQNCLCDRATLRMSTTGHYEILEIQDRRWIWARNYITASYNVRFADGSIDPATTASLQQIVLNLFTAMGETVPPDLTDIVSTEQPELRYDHDNAADCLDELLSLRGYVVSLMSDDSVKVCVRGRGATLPADDDVVSVSISLDPPEPPYAVYVCGDQTMVQSKLKLWALGVDKDGTVKKAANLSFAPAGGWAGTDLVGFAWMQDQVAKDLALKYVGKLYGVSAQGDGTFNIHNGGTNYCPGEITVTSAWQYLPLEPELLSTYTDVFGKKQRSPILVEGTFYNTTANINFPQNQNTPAFTQVNARSYTFNRKTGTILFAEPSYKSTAAAGAGRPFDFADVYLTCSYSIHDATTQIKDRYIRNLVLGGTGRDLTKVDSLQRLIIVNYAANSATVTSITDNLTTVDSAADLYLAAAANKYTTLAANLVLWRGIKQFSTDGVALQIRWDVAMEGQQAPFGTLVAQNFEGIPLLPQTSEKAYLRQLRQQSNATNRRNKRRQIP